MAIFISRSPEETAQFARRIGETSSPGTVLGLAGDLGAGKTHFVKGLAQGLGVPERVHSPTFALVHHYAGGRLPLVHIDLYRLESAAAIERAGIPDCIAADGLTVIEWIDRWPGFGSSGFQRVQIEVTGDQERTIHHSLA